MQKGLYTYLFSLTSSLAFVSSVWASDLHPLGEWNDYVKLDAVNAVNQHPASFSAEQLTRLLGQFYKLEVSKDPAPYFSQDEISRLPTKLVPLFAKQSRGMIFNSALPSAQTGRSSFHANLIRAACLSRADSSI